MKRSTDDGKTWSKLETIVEDASQPEPVYDAVRQNLILSYNVHGGASILHHANWQTTSADDGRSWGPPRRIDTEWPAGVQGAAAGPGVGLQLSAANPYAPDRLLFIGHRGPYVEDFVWHSDDGGATYHISNSSLLDMDEAQLVELPNGTVAANMRNKVALRGPVAHGRGIALSTDGGRSFGPVRLDPHLPEPVCMGASAACAGNLIHQWQSVCGADGRVDLASDQRLVLRQDRMMTPLPAHRHPPSTLWHR
jgi:sialidase-1